MENTSNSDQELKSRLNQETSKIGWEELQRFYASGAVIGVAKGEDLIETAVQISRDNKSCVEAWLASGAIFKINDKLAAQWFEQKPTVWAVVVAPWVLVQEI